MAESFADVSCNPVNSLVPKLFLRGRKDPGRSWSREFPDFGDNWKCHLGRGGRGVDIDMGKICYDNV